MTLILPAYLAIGSVISVAFGVIVALRYRAHVCLPAAAIHGAQGVAIEQDALTLFVVCALLVVGWLPIGLAYGYIKARRLTSRKRSRDNNPTPTL